MNNETGQTVVYIGVLSKTNKSPLQTIAREFINGLGHKYSFRPYYANRRHYQVNKADLNLVNIFYFFKHFLRWTYGLIRYRPDISHYPITSYFNMEKSLLFLAIAKLFRSRAIGHLHGGAFDLFWSQLTGIRKRFAISIFQSLDGIVVTSENWKKWICENIGLPPNKVYVVYNPIESEFVEAALLLPPGGNGSILFLGSLGHRKGVFDILEVARILNHKGYNNNFHLVGPEDKVGEEREIERIIREKGITNIVISQPIYGKDKLRCFASHGIFLFPSYNENFPLVVLEAAASGKAIITTKVGGLPDFFEHNHSVIFVSPGNIEEIADALCDLIGNPQKRSQLGENARAVFTQKLSSSTIMQSLDHAYQEIMK